MHCPYIICLIEARAKRKHATRLGRSHDFPNHLLFNPIGDSALLEGMVVMWWQGVNVISTFNNNSTMNMEVGDCGHITFVYGV